MVSIETEARLARLFAFIGRQEHQIQMSRQDISRLPNFEPYACFQRIDRLEHGYLTSTDLFHFYLDNNIQASQSQCAYIVTYFDSNTDAQLSFFDFLHMLLPCQNPTLRASASQRPTYEVNRFDFLPREVEISLTRLLERQLILLRQTEALKKDLLSRYDCNMIEAFQLIVGVNGASALSFDQFERFLKKNGHQPDESEIIGLVRRLDRDADFKITYKQFLQAIMPVNSKTQSLETQNTRRQLDREAYIEQSKRSSRNTSPFRRSLNRLTQLEREISGDVPIRIDPRLNGGQIRAQSPLRLSRNNRYDNELMRGSFNRSSGQMMMDTQNSFNQNRTYSHQNYQERVPDTSPYRRSVHFADQTPSRVKSSNRTNKYKELVQPLPQEEQLSRRSISRSKNRSKSPSLYKNYQRNKRSTSPIPNNSLNLSGRRCQACNPSQDSHQNQTTACSVKSPILSKNKKKHSTDRSRGNTLNKNFKKMTASPNVGASFSQTPAKYGKNNMRSSRMSQFYHDDPQNYQKSPYRQNGSSFKSQKFVSPLRPDDEAELVNIFKQQVSLQRQLERERQELALCPDFNLMDFFKFFDRNCKGSVSKYDLETGLAELRVYPNAKEINLFFKRYDIDMDEKLKFTEFSLAFTPKQSQYSAVLHDRNPQFSSSQNHRLQLSVDQFLTRETQAKISDSFKVLFDVQLQGQDIRMRVYNNGLFSLKDAFNACDRDGNGFITLDQFRTVFEDYSMRISEKEVAMLLDRYDRLKQMKISYQLFVEELTPKLRT